MRQTQVAKRYFCSHRVGKCDNKVNTSFVVTFSLPTGEKNVTSQNVEVTDAKGSGISYFQTVCMYTTKLSHHLLSIFIAYRGKNVTSQWRIQDFPEEGAQTP